jgi:hypothetical protein
METYEYKRFGEMGTYGSSLQQSKVSLVKQQAKAQWNSDVYCQYQYNCFAIILLNI